MPELEVTDVQFRVLDSDGPTLAFASITFNEILTINGFSIVEGERGLFVGMPSRKGGDNRYYNIVFINDTDYYQDFTEEIIKEWEEFDSGEEERPRRKSKSRSTRKSSRKSSRRKGF